MFVASVIQHAMRMRHIVICGLPGSTIFLEIISQTRDFRSKKFTEHKMRVLIFSTVFVWNISYYEKNWARFDKKCALFFMWNIRYFCQILMRIEVINKFLKKYSYITLHDNPSSGIRVVPFGRADRRDAANSRFLKICEFA